MTHLEGIRRSFPTFRLMAAPFRWIAESRRRVWCVILILLSMVTAPPLWWAAQLMGLPNVGDPFDVEAFRAKTIPDDRNAFVLYRRAAALFQRLRHSDTSASLSLDLHTQWSKADPEVRRWAEVNREALALYRQGADRPAALDPSLMSIEGFVAFEALRPFQRLALLEASRLEEQGDMAGAWGWYRACLRTIHHVGAHGMVYRRREAQRWHNQLRKRLTGWAADARTTPAQLRQALDDAVACGAIVPSEAFTLKAEYLNLVEALDGRNRFAGRMMPSWLRPATPFLTPERIQSIADAWRVWRREPDRSRRVTRLLTANRLAYYDLPPDQRPSPDPDALSCELYPFGPEAPAKARALSPRALGRWLDSTHDPRRLAGFLNWSAVQFEEVANHRELVILLATELYRRDQGTDPPSPKALVGPYLKSLPAEYPDEQRDGADPEIATTVD
jgi:hypothetical protein